MIGCYNRSVILTYFGAALALAGMYLAMAGLDAWAYLCLIFCGICDLFDGHIARRCKRNETEKAFGVQIDSLADVVSFLALPAVMAAAWQDWTALAAVPYVLAGVIRLAWFNMSANDEAPASFYTGLPVTYAALILPVYEALHLWFQAAFPRQGFAVLYLLIAAAFVMRVPIKKPRGVWYVLFSLLALAVSAAIIAGAAHG
jgi:CDP-diacylglycerol--serine O-phosphatidyltransferase